MVGSQLILAKAGKTAAAETKAGVRTLAFVLPNDERVREEKGTKKVFLKNMQEARFNKIFIPISKRILSEEDAEFVSFYAYFTGTILHEIAHALGVNYVTLPDSTRTTVNRALKDHYSALEEARADIAALYCIREKESGFKELVVYKMKGYDDATRHGAKAEGRGEIISLLFS
jgi:hypothetical protein